MRFKGSFLLIFLAGSLWSQNYLPNQSPDFYFIEAISRYQSGDFTAAKHLIDEYLERKVTPEALYYRAMSAIKSEQKSGEHYVNSFTKDYPLHPLAHKAKFQLAHFYFSQRNYQKALLAYGGMEMNSLDKKQREQAYFEKGYSLLQMKITSQGIASMKEANALGGEYKHASAYYLGVMSEGAEVEQWFLQAAQDEKWKIKSAVYLSQIYLNSQEYEKLQQFNEPVLNGARTMDNRDLHFYTAESYYQQSKYRQAVRFYSDGLGLNVGKPDAETLFKIGHSYYEVGDKQQAVEQLKKSGLNETKVGQASAFQLAKIYTELGQYSSALHAYEVAGASDHDLAIQEEARFLAGKISIQLEQFSQAIPLLESFISDFSTSKRSGEADELLSEAYLNSSNYDLVIEHFEKINSSNPKVKKNYQQVTLLKGMQSFSDRKVEEASGYLAKSINASVDNRMKQDALYWLGECYFSLGDVEKARTSYTRAKDLGTSNPLPYYGLGYLLYNEQKYEDARWRFNEFRTKAGGSHPFAKDAGLRIADCNYALKAYDQALSGYNGLKGSTAPQDYISYQIGLIHQLNGRVEAAVSSFEDVLKMPQSSYRDNALFQLAQTRFEDADFPAAITAFTSYIGQYPDENLAPFARIKRGLCYFNTGDLNNSNADYLFVLDNHIGHAAAQNALLGIQELQKQGISVDFDKYMSAYRAAHPDDSSLEAIEFEQGKTLYFAGDYQSAITKLKQILASNSEGAFKEDIIYYLGDAYDRTGQADEANGYYEQIIDMAPSKYLNRVLDKRGKLLLAQENGEEAIKNYELLKTHSKNRKENYLATEGLMKAYYQTKQFAKAIEHGRLITGAEWKPSNAENQASLLIGKSLIHSGDSIQAIDEFLKVINGGGDELAAEAKYSIGKVQFQQGKHQQSLETLFQLNSTFGAYENWIGESFLLIAENYLKMDELLQAKATLTSLIENFPINEIKRRAQVRLQDIDRLQQAEIEQDTLR